ncbi:MAG: transglycosylase domain-containing protein [Odoribacter sp.]|nr:transglycosylase domain-containing protein [Odoribacter sp.]MDY3034499.1 transglycosylase domain-containing protein [Odoribacter sp.]
MATRKRKSSKRNKHTNKYVTWRILKYFLLAIISIICVCALLVASVYIGFWGTLPTYDELRHIRNDEASMLYTEDGEMIGKYYIENRTNINYKNIPSNAIDALVATEDARFYQHEGVDKISMARVFFKTFLLGKRSSGGGSTISQQLAKNLYPREEQPVNLLPIIKLKEMFIAHRLENIYSKNEILTLYLNTVYFGENTFGLESAAQKYFSVSATDLNQSQAATLIGMLKGPSYYNPRLHPERALRRRNTVINQMVKYNFLTAQEGESLKAQKLSLKYKPDNHYSGLAPYLRELIRQDAVKILEAYNATHDTQYNLYKDGLILTTTLDAEMQKYAEEAVAVHMPKLQQSYYTHLGKREPWSRNPAILKNAIQNSPIYKQLKNKGLSETEIKEELNRKKTMVVYDTQKKEREVEFSSIDSIKYYLKIFQPAVIAIDPQNGKIKAWVGGLDYKFFQYDQVIAPRQVGSVFKPVVYSAAIHNGARLDAYYSNEQRTYPEYDNWTPRNADNNYEGYYTLKGALSKSINTIAVEVLQQTGIDVVINHARSLGITTALPPYPSLALGVADIPLREMVSPFMAFANNGVLMTPYYLDEIRTRDGKIIYQAPKSVGQKVLPANEAHIMSNILASVINEGTGQRLRSTYGLQNEMAGKTGTTQNQVDGWFIGYTPRLVVGVRVGANDINIHFNSLRLGQGASMALPIYGEFMKRCERSNTYSRWKNISFPVPIMNDADNLKTPEFKDHLNFLDKLTNRKLDKVNHTEADTLSSGNEKKEGFFKRLFKRKKERKN